MKITLVSAGTAVYGVLRIDGQHHSLAVGDTLTIDEPKPPPPPDPRFARGGRYATITPTEIRHHDIPEGLHVQWPYNPDADAPQNAEAILGHEPLAALDAERFAVSRGWTEPCETYAEATSPIREYWTKGPGSTTPRWPEQDRSTTMHDYDQPMPETVPAKNDPLDHLDDVIDDLDGELEGLAAALVTVLRPEMTTIQTDSISGERVGPDDRSPRRQRIDMLSARIQRMTRETRTLHERIDL